MVNHNAFTGGPEEYEEVAKSADIPDNGMKRAEAGGAAILLVRLGGNLHAIGATCSHAGGPLDEGSLDGDLVTCPWHASVFCVRDGAVRHGPATFPQPRYVVREEHGRIEVKLAETFH
jgi:nitrite reductase/ring-hydroxylating ferredoxin subunit